MSLIFRVTKKSTNSCSRKRCRSGAGASGIVCNFSHFEIVEDFRAHLKSHLNLFFLTIFLCVYCSTVKAIKNMSLETPATANSDLEELRVVWMIRDCGELLFYLDYVHQLVKSQNSLSRHVVYVDVYLTGLGKGSDPLQMVAQTLFLLTV